MAKRILVLGATGFTGRLICSHLAACPIDFAVGGRDEKKLAALFPGRERIVIDVMDESRLHGRLGDCDILVNAVGPFNLMGRKVVETAAKLGLTYLDICGEQHFVKQCFDQIDNLARKHRALIVHSCAFESMTADLLAAKICDPAIEYEQISSFYHFRNPGSSAGTKLSMKLARYFPSVQLKNGKLEAAAPLSHHREVEINGMSELQCAAFMPFPEVLFFHREYRVLHAASHYLFADCGSVPKYPNQMRSQADLQRTLERFRRVDHLDPSEEERKQHQFSLAVTATARSGDHHQILLHGRDMYDLTARLISRCVMILEEEKPPDCGVRTPAQVFARKDLLQTMPQIGGLIIS
jgi:short subunit dehydrogenase-like uncharacterized protein